MNPLKTGAFRTTLFLAFASVVCCGRGGGPLTVHPTNPRYFADGKGRAVYLTGSHNWYNLQDRGTDSLTVLDFDRYLDFLDKYGHNFTRLWAWENAAWLPGNEDTVRLSPLPYSRTGPGAARDGRPQFDLTQFNPDYFDRMRERVEAAGERGIYVMIMLFEGWSIEKKGRKVGNPWDGHPFNRANNVNGIDGDPDGDGEGIEIHTLDIPEVTALQEAYIRRVIDTVNHLDNVLYEISNESPAGSVEWHYHMIDFIHAYEDEKPKQHPVVMTVPWPDGDDATLFAGPAEAISPNGGPDRSMRTGTPPADGSKVVLLDTDHLWGLGGNEKWVWMSFTRGYNPVFMDTMEEAFGPNHWGTFPPGPEVAGRIRLNMGYARRYAERMDLAAAVPHGELASTGYCLANPGGEAPEYLVYLPDGGTAEVDLRGTDRLLRAEWFNPAADEIVQADAMPGGAKRELTAPFAGQAVLYLTGK